MQNNLKYEKTKKAYWVGHRDIINQPYHPEIECSTIHVKPDEGSSKARYKFYSNEYLPDSYKFTDIRAKRQKDNDKYSYEGRELYLSEINSIVRRNEWHDEMTKLVTENPGAEVYIWSGQWGSYLGENYSGYWSDKSQAGIYKIEDAWKRVSHCGIEKGIEFKFVNK
jgi:hypothetical protein